MIAILGVLDEPTRAQLEAFLVCRKCDAMNRPGVVTVHLESTGRVTCDTCGHVDHVADVRKEKTV